MVHEHIFQSAKDFFDAFMILSKNNEYVRSEITKNNPFDLNFSPEVKKRFDSGELRESMLAAIVCLSFSIELYLKGLITKLTGNPPMKHLLKDLFFSLPDDAKTEIIKNTEMNYGESMSEQEFMDCLAGINNAFVEWRYIYENGKASFRPNFGVSFVRAIAAEAGHNIT